MLGVSIIFFYMHIINNMHTTRLLESSIHNMKKDSCVQLHVLLYSSNNTAVCDLPGDSHVFLAASQEIGVHWWERARVKGSACFRGHRCWDFRRPFHSCQQFEFNM